MANTRVTTDHEEIRRWAEERGGVPATVRATEQNGEPGILRIDFPGFSGEDTLEEISWDDFFRKFDENNLAFVYEADSNSRFNKLVSRETVEQKTGSRRRRTGAPARASQTRSGSTAARGTARTRAKRSSSTRSTRSTRSKPRSSRKTASAKSRSTRSTSASAGRNRRRTTARAQSGSRRASSGKRKAQSARSSRSSSRRAA